MILTLVSLALAFTGAQAIDHATCDETWRAVRQNRPVSCDICNGGTIKDGCPKYQSGGKTWSCNYAQETVQDVNKNGNVGERRMCAAATLLAQEGGCCNGGVAIQDTVHNLNGPCNLCEGQSNKQVPQSKTGEKVDTGFAGDQNCGGLAHFLSVGGVSATMCPKYQLAAGLFCCNEQATQAPKPKPPQVADADCELNDAATKAQCPLDCGSVSAVVSKPAVGKGAACSNYQCKSGNGLCDDAWQVFKTSFIPGNSVRSSDSRISVSHGGAAGRTRGSSSSSGNVWAWGSVQSCKAQCAADSKCKAFVFYGPMDRGRCGFKGSTTVATNAKTYAAYTTFVKAGIQVSLQNVAGDVTHTKEAWETAEGDIETSGGHVNVPGLAVACMLLSFLKYLM